MLADVFQSGGGDLTVGELAWSCVLLGAIGGVSYVFLSLSGWVKAWRHGSTKDRKADRTPWVDRDGNLRR